jgi:hypothetical protein
MKDLIRQIEALRPKYNDNEIAMGKTMMLEEIVEILQSHPVIHAKGLRKKGTDNDWYVFDRITGWGVKLYPDTDNDFADIEMMQEHYAYFEKAYHLPADAELVDLTIIVENNL